MTVGSLTAQNWPDVNRVVLGTVREMGELSNVPPGKGKPSSRRFVTLECLMRSEWSALTGLKS